MHQQRDQKSGPDRTVGVVEDQNYYDFVSSTDKVEAQHGQVFPGRPSRGSAPSHLSPTASPSISASSPPTSLTSLGSFRTSLGVELAHPLASWVRQTETPPISRAPTPAAATAPQQQTIPGPNGKQYTQEITYWNYIHPEVLASLQTGRQGMGLNHHDEHLFILVHQTFELWFKQILWELDWVRDYLAGTLCTSEINPLYRANQRLARADKIMRLATEGYAIMETMDPQDFLEFRDFLSPSSGFQSIQFRELEILLGLRDGDRIQLAGRDYREAFYANGENKTTVFDQRLKQMNLKDSLMLWLNKQELPELDGFFNAYMQVRQLHTQAKKSEIEEELEMLEALAKKTTEMKELNYIEHLRSKVNAQKKAHQTHHVDTETFFTDPEVGKARKVALLLWTYQNHNLYAERARLCYGLLQFEQATIIWRNRHARMVELFIGRKMGTGGSSGVDYIDSTANQYRIFLDLWRIRSLGVARDKISTFTPQYMEIHKYTHTEHHDHTTKSESTQTSTTQPTTYLTSQPPHPLPNGSSSNGGGMCPFGYS